MFIRLYFVYFFIFISQILASCPYIRTSNILTQCIFDTNLYISLGAHISNSNSIDFLGHYSFNHNNYTKKFLSNTLVQNLGNRWMLLLPLLLKCSHQPENLIFTECQYTIRQNQYTSTITEYMTTQLSIINVTDLGMQSVLFLQPGEITLRSCKAYDCSKELVYLTASNETFNFKITYEKPIGTKCQLDEDCSNRYALTDLIQCDQISQTCQCYDENITTIDIPSIGRLCTDSIDQSNCTKFPQRCLQWCNESLTSNCICPKYTRKVRKINGIYDCELEPRGICRFNDGLNIRKCPTGTICDGKRCRSLKFPRQMYENYSNASFLLLTTSIYSSTSTLIDEIPTNFLRILVIISVTSLIFFILIIFIIAILIKLHRFRLTSSSEDKVSSSSFAPSTLTAISSDFPSEIYQFKSSEKPIIPNNYTRRYWNDLPTKSQAFIPGLVPQTNLSSRFHRPYYGFDERRRVPLYIQSPTLSRINPFIDHGLLTIDKYNTKKRTNPPRIARLHNGDVFIPA